MTPFLTLENLSNDLTLTPINNPLNLSGDRIYQLELVDFIKGTHISEERCNIVPETQEWYAISEGVLINNKIRNSECNTDTQRLVLKEDLPNWLARKIYL